MELVIGIIGSILATILVGCVVWLFRWWRGRRITITDPEENAYFGPAEQMNGIVVHAVRGTLKRLPRGHNIWLLVVDEAKGRVWPQGFARVVHDRGKGTWKGYIHVWGWTRVTLVAVVAPPTSHDYFTYYQLMGTEFKSGYQPIPRIPRECTELHKVTATVPQGTAVAG